jgi:hypothetical protein
MRNLARTIASGVARAKQKFDTRLMLPMTRQTWNPVKRNNVVMRVTSVQYKYDVQCMYVSGTYASPLDFQADPTGRIRIAQVPDALTHSGSRTSQTSDLFISTIVTINSKPVNSLF